jgi:hypothetical protein
MKIINRYRCPACKQIAVNQRTLKGAYRTTKTYRSFCVEFAKDVRMVRVTGPRKRVTFQPSPTLLKAAKRYYKTMSKT